MKTNTAIMAMIVAFVAMIGMTGLAMADSEGEFMADGDTSGYYADYFGTGGGVVHINTYTDDGRDHKTITYDNDMNGWQAASPGSTNIARYDQVDGGGEMTTYSRDNGDAIVTTRIESTDNLKMFQNVILTDVEEGCVGSYTMGAANAEYSMQVATSTDAGTKRTSVTLAGLGHAEMGAEAEASAGYTYIGFGVGDITRPFPGPSYGGTNGEGDLTVRTYSNDGLGLNVNGPGTYTFTSRPGSMVYTTSFSDEFDATGYVYAVTI